MTGSKPGTIDLSWIDDGTANQYDIVYGINTNSNMWGVQDIKEAPNTTNRFMVDSLEPGKTYVFTLVAETSGTFVAKSGPVSTTAASGIMQQATAVVAPMQPATPTSVSSGPTSRYNFQVMTGSKSGSVDLKWTNDTSANQFDVVYGIQPGQYMWGVQNIPVSANMNTMFTVSALQPGVRYYFALVSEVSGTFVLKTDPISAIAK